MTEPTTAEQHAVIDELWIRGARILRLQPGDVLVYRTTRRISDQEADDLKREFRENLPGYKVLLAECGDDIDIARPITAGEAPA